MSTGTGTAKATQSNPQAEAAPLLQSLTAQANTLYGAILKQSLVSIDTGGSGEFPYYYTNPTNLLFNNATWSWIDTSLVSGASPAQLADEQFTNVYIELLSKVGYSLSSADQATLNAASANATNQQMALLNAWKAAYGSIPSPTATQAAD
jgi:hypothetical protein